MSRWMGGSGDGNGGKGVTVRQEGVPEPKLNKR